jgi:hypothetical protein
LQFWLTLALWRVCCRFGGAFRHARAAAVNAVYCVAEQVFDFYQLGVVFGVGVCAWLGG